MRIEPLTVLHEVESEAGIARTFANWQTAGSPPDREEFYLRRLATILDNLRAQAGVDLTGMSLVLSGMASSSIGLRELPYCRTPFPLTGGSVPVARWRHEALPVEIVLVSGVCTDDDVMRGEETILLGLTASGHGDGLYLLPGTHSKHVVVRDGAITQFRTYLTGEMFALLREHSVLRTCLEPGDGPDEEFVAAAREGGTTALLHELFVLRARTLLRGATPLQNGQRLSGLLIGAELTGLQTSTGPIVLAAAEPLRSYYLAALDALGLLGRVCSIEAGDLALAVARGQAAILSGSPR